MVRGCHGSTWRELVVKMLSLKARLASGLTGLIVESSEGRFA